MSGTVWNDLNVNAYIDGGEPDLSNVTVDLLDAKGRVVATTTTDANGNYTFSGVPRGGYTVTITDRNRVLNGFELTSGLDSIPVAVWTSNITGVNFGYVRPPYNGSIGDFVWFDSDRDGVQDAGEGGISGVTLNLYSTGTDDIIGNGDDVLIGTTTTDATGHYTFEGLAPGNYYVDPDETTLPSGLAATFGTGGNSGMINLSASETYDKADFGYASSGGTVALGDRVWYDADGNGLQDPGEVGIGGVTITITGPSGTFHVTTRPDGSWLQTGLAPGDYTVTVDATNFSSGVLQPPYNATPTNGPVSRTLTVPPGQDVLYADFGFNGGTAGTIGDTVFLDPNGNGVQNSGEPGLADVTLNLINQTTGAIIASTVTDSDGHYSFVGVPAGTYTVQVTDINGKLAGLVNSTVNPITSIVLASGATYNDADFGYVPTAGSIGDLVWNDINGDGVHDAGEPGIQGVEVDLYFDVNGDGLLDPGVDNLIRTTYTDVNGQYGFEGLPVGSFLVDVVETSSALTGFSKTTGPNPGTNDNSQSDPYVVVLTTSTSIRNDTADFGFQATGTAYSITGITFEDVNNNGAFNSGTDKPTSSVLLYLYRDLDGDGVLDPGEPLIDQTVSGSTGTAGAYTFDGLPNGHYIVQADASHSILNGFQQTTQTTSGGVQPVFINNADSANNNLGFYAPGGAQTTPVTLSYFHAFDQGETLRFDWSTSLEIGNVGFNLFAKVGGDLRPINDTLIASQAVDSTERLDYTYTATGVEGSTFYIQDVDVLGQPQMHGPFALGQASGQRIAPDPIDWASIQAENDSLAAQRLAAERAAAEAQVAQAQLSDGHGFARVRRSVATALEWVGGLFNGKQAAADSGYPVFNLTLDHTGLYRVTYEQLAAAGLDLDGVAAADIALTSQGASVPVRVVGDPFGPGSFIEFYGEALDTLYTHTNVYALHVDHSLVSQVAVDNTPVDAGAPVASYYMAQATYGSDKAYSFSSPNGDPWYDTSMLARTSSKSWNYTIAVDNYAASAAPATLDVQMWGSTDWPQSPDHRVVVGFNGTNIADLTVNGIVNIPVTANLPDGTLQSGNNTLKVTLPGDTGVAYDLVMFDKATVTYPRGFVAKNGALTFDGSAQAFRVTNLPSPNVTVYRIDSDGSQTLLAASVDGSGGSYSATFAGTSHNATYIVTADSAVRTPDVVPGSQPVDLLGGKTDFLIIAHPNFIDGIQTLAQVRAAQGLKVRVVSVDDVYAQYSGGVFDPQAIRDYIKDAVKQDGVKYVLLVGGDTYDYLHNTSASAISFIPTLYAPTDDLGIVQYAPVDPLYADVNGDNVPDVALGRFPVRTNAELDSMIAKTLAYETNDYGQTAVFAADIYDGSGDQPLNFSADSDALISQLGDGWSVQRAYLDNSSVAAAQATLVDAINNGVALTSFIGHSSYDRWTFSGLFSMNQATALTNAGSPTIISQWGCWNTYFVSPTANTLGHAFLLSGDRGAAAVMGSSTLTEDASETALGHILNPYLVQPGMRIGDAITQAKADLAVTDPSLRDVYLGWTLLGDPTLTVVRDPHASMAPVVDAGANVSTNMGDEVGFSGTVLDLDPGDSTSAAWDFGDGTTGGDTLTPTHVYTWPGVYTVTLTATDSTDKTGSDTLTVTVGANGATVATIQPNPGLSAGEVMVYQNGWETLDGSVDGAGRLAVQLDALPDDTPLTALYTVTPAQDLALCGPAGQCAITLNGAPVDTTRTTADDGSIVYTADNTLAAGTATLIGLGLDPTAGGAGVDTALELQHQRAGLGAGRHRAGAVHARRRRAADRDRHRG